ncbi:MAG TPA: hypothetical protein VFT87_02405 [Candidatus Saccharimonadales bacterium]|nr:hypothetical protein [Candidatus Saccharimonadales bacterium]
MIFFRFPSLKRDGVQPEILHFTFVVPSTGFCRLIGEVNINTRRGSLDPEQPTNPALAWLALDPQTEALLENRGLLTLEALLGFTEGQICTKLLINPLRFGGPPLQSAQAAVERFVALRARLETLGFNQSFAGPRLSEQELLGACFPKEAL